MTNTDTSTSEANRCGDRHQDRKVSRASAFEQVYRSTGWKCDLRDQMKGLLNTVADFLPLPFVQSDKLYVLLFQGLQDDSLYHVSTPLFFTTAFRTFKNIQIFLFFSEDVKLDLCGILKIWTQNTTATTKVKYKGKPNCCTSSAWYRMDQSAELRQASKPWKQYFCHWRWFSCRQNSGCNRSPKFKKMQHCFIGDSFSFTSPNYFQQTVPTVKASKHQLKHK